MKVSKDFYALTLNESQTAKLISNIEAEITELMNQLNEKLTPLKEAEELYTMLKEETDKLQKELDDNKLLLEALSRFKNNDKSNKELRILRTTSFNDKKPKQQRKFRWLDMIEDLLRREDRFLSKDEIFDTLLKENSSILESVGGNRSKLTVMRNTVLNNLDRACKITRQKNKGRVIEYKGKIGLFEWVLDDFTPDPQHIKQFMFS